MSFTMTITASESFTLTHAKYLASKVTADMRRCQQLYGKPSDADRNDYGTELALMLRDNYVSSYEFGFKLDEQRVVSWHYAVTVNGLSGGADDRPGKIWPGVDVSKAYFFNFMSYSSSWWALSTEERQRIKDTMPVQRQSGNPPSDSLGYWESDLGYSANGTAMARRTFKPYTTLR